MIIKLIPLSHLNVFYYLMLVSFKKQPVKKRDTEVACSVGGFGRATRDPQSVSVGGRLDFRFLAQISQSPVNPK